MPVSLDQATKSLSSDISEISKVLREVETIQRILQQPEITPTPEELNVTDKSNNTLLIKSILLIDACDKEMEHLNQKLGDINIEGQTMDLDRANMSPRDYMEMCDLENRMMDLTVDEDNTSKQLEELKKTRKACIEIATALAFNQEVDVNKENFVNTTALYYLNQIKKNERDEPLQTLRTAMSSRENIVAKGPKNVTFKPK